MSDADAMLVAWGGLTSHSIVVYFAMLHLERKVY